jgi:integrase
VSIEKKISKNGNTTYSVRERVGGKQRRWTFDRKADAQAFQAQLRLQKRRGELAELDAGTTTLDEFRERWWEMRVSGYLADSTAENYATVWRLHVSPHLGELPLREITPRVVDRWRVDLTKDGLGTSAVCKSISVLSTCLTYATTDGEITANPCRDVRKPRIKRRRRVTPVTPIVVERMRVHLIERGKLADATLVSLLAYAGLRPQEARALTWEHVRKNTLLIEQAASGTTIKSTKTGKIRSVELLSALREDLALWREASGGSSGLVLPAADGTVWSNEAYKSWSRRAFADAIEATGREYFSPYTLRHSFASLLIQEGRTVVEVAAQLGHAPTMTLDTYAHVISELRGDGPIDIEQMIAEARRETGQRHIKCASIVPPVPFKAPAGEEKSPAIPL